MMLPFEDLVSKYNMNITGIVHLGANTGQERDLYRDCCGCEVLWFEAIPSVFEQLRLNLLPYHNQVAIKGCLSDTDGEKVIFNISNNESQSSSILELGIHETIHPEVHYIDHQIMTTTRFDTLLALLERDTRHINFANLDLQGAELKAMKGMGKFLNQIDYIITEVNAKETYMGCALVGEIDEFLTDFKRVETGDYVGGCWSDALYINKRLL